MIDIQKIIKAYDTALWGSEEAKKYSNPANYTAVQKFADIVGDLMSRAAAKEIVLPELTTDEAVPAFTAMFKRMHYDVSRIARTAQLNINHDAGTELNALTPDFDATLARTIAEDLTGKEVTSEYIKNLFVNGARHAVDEFIRTNSEAQEEMGMEVRIERTYDDVGVHNRKDDCQWCLDRVGVWDNYQEAYDAGVFERHPGCGCMIDYHVGKTHTYQTRAGSWYQR